MTTFWYVCDYVYKSREDPGEKAAVVLTPLPRSRGSTNLELQEGLLLPRRRRQLGLHCPRGDKRRAAYSYNQT